MKCVFFGSPDFAVASLEALVASRHQVVGVITQPDRPAGRGLHLEPPAVKVRAEALGIPIFQPERVNTEATIHFLDRVRPDILAVVAYGSFLGEKLLSYCPHPPINVHPSLLPDLRGAAPMQWALLRGYKKTGVSTQFMVKEMDAGDVILQMEVRIGEEETAKDLHDRLKIIGGDLLVETLSALEKGSLKRTTQDSSKATYAPLLEKEQGLVHWDKETAHQIHDKIRGLYPWPSAYTYINKKRVKLLKSSLPSQNSSPSPPGSFHIESGALCVSCLDGALHILELQPEGKRTMLPKDFLNGMKDQNACFESLTAHGG